MEVDSCRRIREHLYVTFHFAQACRMAYIEVLGHGGAATGVGWCELHAAVVKVHEVLSESLPGYRRRAPFPPSQIRVYMAFLTLLVSQETTLSDASFEKFALDVIVEHVWLYLKSDLENRISPMAVMIGAAAAEAAAVGDLGRRAHLAFVYADYCFSMMAITLSEVSLRDRFFRL